MHRISFLIPLTLLFGAAAAQVYFEDFNQGIAHDWLTDQGTWQCQQGAYFGHGAYVNGRTSNFSWVSTFNATNMSVEADMHSDDRRSDDCNKILVLRYNDPNNNIVANFRAGSRSDVIIVQSVNGNGQLLTPEFAYHLPFHTNTEWHHCRVDMVGGDVRCYFDGQLVMDVFLWQIVNIPGAPGVMVLGSGGGLEDIYVDNFRAAEAQEIYPDAFHLDRGIATSGDLTHLQFSDNQSLVCRPGVVLSGTEAPIQLVVEGTAPFTPGEMRLRIEGHANIFNVRETYDVFNFDTAAWETIVDRLAPTADQTNWWNAPAPLTRYIEPTSHKVRARLSYKANGPILSYPWYIYVDQVLWTAVR